MRTLIYLGYIVTASLAACLIVEWQTAQRLASENAAIRRQLEALPSLNAENQQLSNHVVRATASATESQTEELARLRRETDELSRLTHELATLRADSHATLAELKSARQTAIAARAQNIVQQPVTDGQTFQILSAIYGTDHTNVDVLPELLDRARGNHLKMFARPQSVDDPDPNHTKFLTVVYQANGSVMTNQFREGDTVILPPQSP